MRVIFVIYVLISSLFAQHPQSDLFRVRQSRDYIPDINEGHGVVFRDLNGDAMPDIYLVCLTHDNHLLINSGAYRPFKDMTGMANLEANPRPQGVYNFDAGRTIYDYKYGVCSADFDNDGDGDIIVAGWGISTSLFSNEGQLRFKNLTNRLDLFPPVSARGCITADVNNDGLTDLFIIESQRANRLLLNQRDMFFTDQTEKRGLGTRSSSRGAAFCDLDRDGDQDLYVANWQEADLLFQNDGRGNFRLVAFLGDVAVRAIKSSSVSFADLDNDGDFDFVVTTHEAPDYIYINRSAENDSLWLFEQIMLSQNNLRPNSNGSSIGDYDNNGWLDLFITGSSQNEIYFNQGNLVFERQIDTKSKQNSTGAAHADFDLDGDLDLFVTSRDSTALFYQNITNTPSNIKIKLFGVTSNSDAIGAVVDFYKMGYGSSVAHRLGTRHISGGGGYASMSDLTVHFGMDTLQAVDAIIRFPNGTVVTANNLHAGETYTIYEYALLNRTFIQAGQHMLALMRQAEFWIQVALALLFFIMTFIFIRLGLRRYRWSPATASAYLVGFFFLALIAIVALKKLGLIYNLLTINILTVLFVTTVILYSERLLRLRKIREKYRTVLLDLTNQIVNIHDNTELITRVTGNIRTNTEFDLVKVLEIDSDQEQINYDDSAVTPDVVKGKNTKKIINLIRREKYLEKKVFPEIHDFFNHLIADYLIAIERNGKLYGILILGESKTKDKLSLEDIDLFKSIANQMAIAMENNEYILRSTEMIKKLTAAEVREQYLKELEDTNAALDNKNRDLQKLFDELRDTQTQLIHSEKMASLGQLVAGISHELNNPIGFIYANVRQLQQYTKRIGAFLEESSISDTKRKKLTGIMPDIENLINDTISGSQMIKDLVDNLRRFSHLDRSKWGMSDIHQGIESSIKILLAQFKGRIDIHRKFNSAGLIECNAGQLNQVFLNILTNAAQAIEGTGNIWIETFDENEQMIVIFRDDGSGMSTDIQKKIFDPFFTTKDVGEGTGLGLSISYSIIQNHGGRIEVESQSNDGSTFTIILPHRHRPKKPKKPKSRKQVLK
jgi:signal transduction histidine kinase